jgi:DNA polymerase III delta prime subunit
MDAPWVEKYRPDVFEQIVLSPENAVLFSAVIEKNYMPNMLFYGPPGTGKTTTIMNLVSRYQQCNGERNRGLMIHLNASDDRGIDVIRTQINHFVTSKTFFGGGMKFVILDEVDYMTKNAQQALVYLLQEPNPHVRFCLVCNYISKIDDTLQSAFVKVHFNHLPQDKINQFLFDIAQKERIALTAAQATHIQKMFGSDLRSMINYLQCNQTGLVEMAVLHPTVWDDLYQRIRERENIGVMHRLIQDISTTYGVDLPTIMKDFLHHIVVHTPDFPWEKLTDLEQAVHSTAEGQHIVLYALTILLK